MSKIYNSNSNTLISFGGSADSLNSPSPATYSVPYTVTVNGKKETRYSTYSRYTYNVTVRGGGGNDTVNIDSDGSYVYGEDGNDIISGSTSGSVIDGGAGNDNIAVGGISNAITGGTGSDRISTNGSCKSHSTINYKNGDGADVIAGWSHNDTIQLGASTAVASSAVTGTNLKFNIGSGSITFNNADHKFINIRNSSGAIDTYILDGKNTVKAINNFTDSASISDTRSKGFLYNAGSKSSLTGGSGNDFIYNEDRAKFVTINAGKGNDTIGDHSANAMVIYNSGDGDDSINFDDTTDVSGWNNIYHYYGGGVLAVDSGNFSGYSYSGGVNKFKVGSNNLTVNSTCFTIREVDTTKEAGYKYTRYWDKSWPGTTVKKFNSFVYHEGTRFYDDVSVGTYDDPNSASYYKNHNTAENEPKNNEDDYIYTNFGTNATLNGGGGDDWIYNYGMTNGFLLGGTGKDTIHNVNGGYTNNVTIDGGADDDYIYNNGSAVSIFGGTSGKDTIYNGGPDFTSGVTRNGGDSVTIDSGIDNDYIYNRYGSYASIVSGEGNDSIYNYYGSSITVDAGTGNDSIYNYSGSSSSIDAGEGNDTIRNQYGSYVTMNGGDGNDSIYNYSGSYGSIIAGEGDDTIYNYYGSSVTIDGGIGKDSINNSGSYGSIMGGAGNDSINNTGSYSKIDGGDNEDYIYNSGYSVSMAGGSGDDTILNYGNGASIGGGDGNDSINNQSYTGPTSIDGGNGENFINNNAHISTITAGSDNDTIYNNNTSATSSASIDAGAGNNYINNKANKSSITSGDGNDTIINQSATGPAKIDAGDGDNYITNNSSNSTIFSGSGKDTIYNRSEYGPVTINSGDGDDFIYNNSSKSTILSGAGKDTIYNNSTLGPVSISSGDDDDLIYLQHANKVTIEGGKGDDVVTLSATDHNNFVRFRPGDGNDTVYGWEYMTGHDFEIIGTNKYETLSVNWGGTDKGDLLVKVNAEPGGYILFVDVLDPVVTAGKFRGAQLKSLQPATTYSTLQPDNTTITYGGKKMDTINLPDYNDTLTADYSVVAITTLVGSGYKFSKEDSLGDAVNHHPLKTWIMKEDINTITQYKAVKIVGNPADDFIVGGKGGDIILGNDGNDTLEGGAGKDTLTGSDGNDVFVVRAYSPTLSSYRNNHVNENTITDFAESEILKIANGFIEKGEIKNNSTLRLIVKNNPINNVPTNHNKATINILKGVGKKITIFNQDGTFSRQEYGATKITVGDGDGSTINTLWNPNVVTIDGSTRNAAVGLVGNSKNNMIISGVGNNTLTTGTGKDTIVYYGGKDEITDYTPKQDIIKLQKGQQIDSVEVVDSSTKNAKDVIYTLNDGGSIRLDKAVTITYVKGKERRTNKNITFVSEEGYTLTGSGSDLTLTVNDAYIAKNGTQINAPDISPATTLLNASAVSKKYNLNLTGDGTIKAGKGNDTITGGKDDDTLTGGAGKDIFVYTWGKDVITDYSAEDRIILDANQELVNYSMKPKTKHVILSVGTGSVESGTIQLNNGQGKAVTVGEETFTFNAKGATLKAASAGNILDISKKSFVKAVDASAYKTAVNIIGSDEDNVLKGSKLADTLSGGLGDDTLTGGKGNDTFVYKKGNDFITDYAAGDIIDISSSSANEVVSWTLVKNDVIFNLGEGNTLRVKNGKNKNITINDDTRKYTKAGSEAISKYVKMPKIEDEVLVPIDSDSVKNTATDIIEKGFADMWFANDNNFAENDLNSILPTNSVNYYTERAINPNTLLETEYMSSSTITSNTIHCKN